MSAFDPKRTSARIKNVSPSAQFRSNLNYVARTRSRPIITQGAVSVHPGDKEETLAMRVLKTEHRVYPLALKLVAEGRVRVVDDWCLIDGFRCLMRKI
jgi:hypothetical protein